jgi:putative DNA primase/helicase
MDDLENYSNDAKEKMRQRLLYEQQRDAEELQRNLDAITYKIDLNPAECFEKDEFIPARMAQIILRQLPQDTVVTPAGQGREKQTYWYNSQTGVYRPNGIAWIEKLSHRLLKESSKNGRIAEAVGAIQRETLDLSDTFQQETPGYLILENGCLRIEDRELFPHTPQVRSFNRIPVKYDSSAECPIFLKFLSDIVDGDYRLGVQEWFGYTLLKGSHPIRKAFMGLGEGSNGKSTLLEVWAKFLGTENTTNVPLHEIDDDRFAVAEMHGRLANFCPDLPSTALKATTTFKALTGYDQIKAQRKFGQPFTFYSYCKQVFTMNKLPTTFDKSKAFFDRVYLIPFIHTFEGQNRLPRSQLVDAMTTPEELSGIINWALDGLKRLLMKSSLTAIWPPS